MKHLHLSKLISLALMLAIMLVSLPMAGCKMTKDELLSEMDSIYLDIRTIVTDPTVSVLIPADQMEQLATAEQAYLKAVAVIKELDTIDGQSGQVSLEVISGCADTILGVIENLKIAEDHQAEIAAIRLSLKVLRNHIR